MAILVTGGSGQIGAELVHILVARGEEVVVFDINKSKRLGDIEKKFEFVRGNVGLMSEVMDVIKGKHITQIHHMGAMLTSESEANPWASFQTNFTGTYNIFEAARLFGVKQVIFTSSIGTFGMTSDDKLSDTTLQRPGSLYGVAKLYGEGLGRWYNRKFGLDFRGVRYPSVVGPGIATPGHWDAPMIISALSGKTYQCPMPKDMPTAMLYYRDAARAADILSRAPQDKIKMVVYNIGGAPSVTPGQLEAEIRKHIPQVKVNYQPPAEGTGRLNTRSWDDSYARQEWGWQPEYTNAEKLVTAMIQEMKAHPELYGID